MASSKVLVRDAVTARQGGQLLSLDGAMAHCMSLNLPGRGLSDADAESMAATLLAELRRRFAEITAMRNRSSLLELSVRLEGNAIRDRGCAALCSALEKASGIAAVSKLDLRDNRIGDGGFRAVGRLLRNATHALGDGRLQVGARRPVADEPQQAARQQRGAKAAAKLAAKIRSRCTDADVTNGSFVAACANTTTVDQLVACTREANNNAVITMLPDVGDLNLVGQTDAQRCRKTAAAEFRKHW